MMETILERIVTHTRKRLFMIRPYSAYEVAEIMAKRPKNSFLEAIGDSSQVHIIAEIKCASPSKGKLVSPEKALEILSFYEEGGASAISVVTEEEYFGGNVALLEEVVATTSLPVLRKDFVIEETQIYESAQKGVGALLLIARILHRERLKKFVDLCTLFGIVPLVEVHDEKDLEKALFAGAKVLGVNNRNLATFEVSLKTTLHLLPLIPPGVVVVSESGIKQREDIMILREKGVRAFLIGEVLLTAKNPVEKLRELKGEKELARC
ncbi:MAG: indole-3-glycerol phosphate synthase TrpC [Atribacterota bacterium]|nr:indole-3-glycerol phosphate synthase TrpC [Atribacterota bacterium]